MAFLPSVEKDPHQKNIFKLEDESEEAD